MKWRKWRVFIDWSNQSNLYQPLDSSKNSKSTSPSCDSPLSGEKEKSKRSKSSSKEKTLNVKPERTSTGGKKVQTPLSLLDSDLLEKILKTCCCLSHQHMTLVIDFHLLTFQKNCNWFSSLFCCAAGVPSRQREIWEEGEEGQQRRERGEKTISFKCVRKKPIFLLMQINFFYEMFQTIWP